MGKYQVKHTFFQKYMCVKFSLLLSDIKVGEFLHTDYNVSMHYVETALELLN